MNKSFFISSVAEREQRMAFKTGFTVIGDSAAKGQGFSYHCINGQDLRMEHDHAGCRLYLELPPEVFGQPTPVVGFKMASGTEIVFDFVMISRGRALYELRSGHPARSEGQDQQVCWLGGPARRE